MTIFLIRKKIELIVNLSEQNPLCWWRFFIKHIAEEFEVFSETYVNNNLETSRFWLLSSFIEKEKIDIIWQIPGTTIYDSGQYR